MRSGSLSDQVAIDIGAREQIMAIEAPDTSELNPHIKKDAVVILENPAVAV